MSPSIMAQALVSIAYLNIFLPSALFIRNESYWLERERLMQEDHSMMLGSSLNLTEEEERMNDLIMTAKRREMDEAFKTLRFPPSRNFLLSKQEISQSDVYKLIKRMPKGAALHLHEAALTSADWVIETITYWPDLYMCYVGEQLMLRFFETPDKTCDWQLVSEVRSSYPNSSDFDEMLHRSLTLITDDPEGAYPNINIIWRKFERSLTALMGLIMCRPAWEAYLYEALLQFSDDNVLYLEFRGVLPPLYEKNGTLLSPIDTMDVYSRTCDRFVREHGDRFFAAKYIYAPVRRVNESVVRQYVETAVQLKKEFPNFVAGFDLVGQEDKGRPLIDFLDPLLSLAENSTVPVYYHAGETNWFGTTSDENLVDALLLNATRLGHAYAITKHPRFLEMVLAKDVPLEVCPISNQILKLVDDLRNHPVISLMAQEYPIVISSDDPAAWGADPLSHDFYEAFMAFGGARADLRFLKQLALNSIWYASLSATESSKLMSMWEDQWKRFIRSEVSNEIAEFVDPDASNNNSLYPNEVQRA